MDIVINRLKPAKGMSSLIHNSILIAFPLTIFALVRLNESEFTQLALILIILSKWRMFAVRPRFWPANFRANAVDLMVGLSVVLLMTHSLALFSQLFLALAYVVWLVFIKPSHSTFMISVQAGIGQLIALSALFISWADGPTYGLTLATGLICYFAARHFFDAFDETYSKLLSYLWGYFGASLGWLLSHWLLLYGNVTQITVLLTSIGYGIGAIYYWDHNEKLTKNIQRQFMVIMLAIVFIVFIVLIFSDWGSKVV